MSSKFVCPNPDETAAKIQEVKEDLEDTVRITAKIIEQTADLDGAIGNNLSGLRETIAGFGPLIDKAAKDFEELVVNNFKAAVKETEEQQNEKIVL